MEAKTVCYWNAKKVVDGQLVFGAMTVKDGVIISGKHPADEVIDLNGAILAPGYIDIQLNGGFGWDFTHDPEGVREVAERLPATGVTSFIPTLVSSEPDSYRRLIPAIGAVVCKPGAAQVLGLHLEGPFISGPKRGAHDPSCVQACASLEEALRCYGSLGKVRIVTLAPEACPGLIEPLISRGITVSLGHTSASTEEARLGLEQGATLVTHLFNAMPGLHHRDPGLVGLVLGDRSSYFSLIVDGIHVCPEVVRLAWQSHPDGLVLVTDAMAAMGLPDGQYSLGTMTVDVHDGRADLAGTRTLAGSVITMDAAVKNFHRMIGGSVAEAIEAASTVPARLLGISDRKGSLAWGSDADFLILSEDLQVLETYIAGERVYRR